MWLKFIQTKQIKELKAKTDFAVSSENLLKIEFGPGNDLGKIAENFNIIGRKYADLKVKATQFDQLKTEHQELGGKVNLFESSISQITLLTDIGKDITSSLSLTEILGKVFRYIYSSMMADEVHLMIAKNSEKLYYVIKEKEIKLIEKGDWTLDKDNILNWSFNNNKDLMLQDAQVNYARYVFKPIHLYDKSEAGSVVGIPFGFNTEQTGSIAVMSKNEKAFDHYHQDFIKSLASYIAVAIDNSNLYGQLDDEKKKSDSLLLNILPEEVAEELKQKGRSEAKQYEHVTVLFTDFVNFTGISEKLSPKELVAEIDLCFKAFDAITEKHNLEKIKTIGDAYLAVCGMPVEDPDHAKKAVRASKDIIEFMQKRKKEGGLFEIRIGLNSGPVVAGIVGSKKFAYDIWGDTVNTASRMESSSESGKINVSGATFELIKNDFTSVYRGKIDAKNKGMVDMYFVS